MLGAVSSDDPIFLVSMCGTPEDFLTAFRRYVDRHGLFVPTATPAPALHHGRFAITLSDGRVMVEGEAEIASSSSRPSALYGRTGMTLHFTSVDDASRAALAALEKAKLSIKVTSHAAALEARPSRLTAPVEHPPVKVAGGSLDKTLVMAECVMVGDAASLTPGRVGKSPAPGKAGGRFVIPSIQPTGAVPAATISGKQAASAATPTVAGPPVIASTRHPAIDDGPSEATEVGPIVEEAMIQPSGPTLTTAVPPELGSSPMPPEALAAAVMAGGRRPIDSEIETTMGGPPPMPQSVPSPITRQPSAPVTSAGSVADAAAAAPPVTPVAARPSSPPAGVPVAPVMPMLRTPLGPAAGRPEPPVRAVTAPIAGLVPSRAPSSLPTSVPPIAPLRAPTPTTEAAAQGAPVKRPSSHAIPSLSAANGPSKRPSSQVIPTSLGMSPQAPASAVASGPISTPPLRPSSTALGAAPMAQAPSSLSGPASRPPVQALRNGAAAAGAGAGPSGPASRPSGSAIAPMAAAPAASQPSPVPRMTPPVPSAPVVSPRAESNAAERGADRSGLERKSSSGIRRTSIGIAATYIEPAPASAAPTAPLSADDSAAVPEAVHDSMFEIPDREPEAVPEPSDQGGPAALAGAPPHASGQPRLARQRLR
jgi:hypothetical protein